MWGPVAGFPEAITFHLSATVTERSVAIRSSLQVEIPQLLQISPNYLRENEREHWWVRRGVTTLSGVLIQSSHRRWNWYLDLSFTFSHTLTTSSFLWHFHLMPTWSASTKMILSTASGNRTSRKRILYPQIMRCFSVCWWSQRGHLYCTSSYWKPRDSAISEMVS